MTVLTDLATFVTRASMRACSPQDKATQRDHVTDAVVAALAGCRTPEFRPLASLFTASSADRTGLMAAAIRLTEIDDIHMRSCTTPSAVVVPVALMLAAEDQSAHAAMADAIGAGLELLCRFGEAVDGPSILYREVWPTYLCAPLAAAATAARMLRLDEKQTAIALSVALTLTAGGSGRFDKGTSPRWLLHAIAVRSGLVAARAAQAGFGGDIDLFERDWLKRSHGITIDLARFLGGLGDGTSAYAELSMKPYCSAKQAIAATQAFHGLLDEGLAPQTIRSITVRVPPAYAKMIDRKPETGSRSSLFASVRYQMALAAYNRDRLYDIARSEAVLDDPMTALMGKVVIEADEALMSHYPQNWPAVVSVETADGRLERTVVHALGDPQARLTGEALSDKARRVLAQLTDRETGEDIVRVSKNVMDDPAAAQRAVAMFASVADPLLG
jgi:2-methylcitrate dehydratase PrpD